MVTLFLISICFNTFSETKAQNTYMTFGEVIEMARENSFEAFKAKNLYLDKAFDYQIYLKLLYPKATFSLTPANYSRSIQEQWNSESEQYKAYNLQSLTSKGDLTLTQPVGMTGGTLMLNSYLYRYNSFKEDTKNYTTYISYPIRLTYYQNLARINTFRWRAKTAPIEFEEAKKQYLEDIEEVTIKATNLFF